MKVNCSKCGCEIPEGRLKALPYIKCCVNCSNTKIKKAIVVTGGEGDHTWNDIQIVSEKEYDFIMEREKELQDFLEKDEN